MAWARQHGVHELHVLADDDAGVLARRASLFRQPPSVWWVNGTDLHAVEPEPIAPPASLSDAGGFGALFEDVGLEVVRERNHVAGELRGLEVARVVDDRLEVGVGEADRELTAMLHGALAPADALERVVSIVREHRRPGAPRHPPHPPVPRPWVRWALRNETAPIWATPVVSQPPPPP